MPELKGVDAVDAWKATTFTEYRVMETNKANMSVTPTPHAGVMEKIAVEQQRVKLTVNKRSFRVLSVSR